MPAAVGLWHSGDVPHVLASVGRAASRPLLAGMFVYGGLDAARHPEAKLPRAEAVTGPVAAALPAGIDASDLVRANGVAQVAAGLVLASGRAPRLAAAVLAASLVPTTFAAHAFWRETEPGPRAQQTIQFLKNAAMLGGLLAVVTGAPTRR